jgi:undecaprenyl diphosphate synthase
MPKTTITNVPVHIGLILDGNRRWAKQRGLPPFMGHQKGYETLKDVADWAFAKGVKHLSVYTFSTENWSRTPKEVDFLMNLTLKMLSSDLNDFDKKSYKLSWLGNSRGLSKKLIQALENATEKTKNNKKGNLILCFNYGGQLEIAEAVKKIIKKGIEPSMITEATIGDNLYCPEIPPVDIIVRTSGEKRLSNFMLWRAAYSELMFVDKMWPDFNEADLDGVINEYTNRQRRFGV